MNINVLTSASWLVLELAVLLLLVGLAEPALFVLAFPIQLVIAWRLLKLELKTSRSTLH